MRQRRRGQLLIHNLGDGWEPLCLHLGVPVPDQSYPNRNNTKDFQSALAQN
uniref:sulfotransferase n=1 Tax=Mesorhizobium caraganae TaxID=483206 RepID=UPI001FEDFB4A|nr:sulfotransferase [Mesorhizobium caraganae]